MYADRPLLVCVPRSRRRRRRSRGVSERAFLAGDFPQRLILRSRDFLRTGPALVYGLYRAGLREKPLPTLIAV